MDSFIQLDNFVKIMPYTQLFKQGLLVTVLLSLFTVAIGFCIALVLALMRLSNVRPLRFLGIDQDGHQREEGVRVLRQPSPESGFSGSSTRQGSRSSDSQGTWFRQTRSFTPCGM